MLQKVHFILADRTLVSRAFQEGQGQHGGQGSKGSSPRQRLWADQTQVAPAGSDLHHFGCSSPDDYENMYRITANYSCGH